MPGGSEQSNVELLAMLTEVCDAEGFSGVVAIDRPGHAPIRYARGLADRRWSVPMTTDTRLSIASGTKGFTALAAMSLVEQGVLSLDTTARSLLGDDLPLVDDRVTVMHLLTHTSGIGDYLDEELFADVSNYVMPLALHQMSSAEAYVPALEGRPQRSAPGDDFVYNNSGFVLLAVLSERASGVPHIRLIEDLVCAPGGMLHTGFIPANQLPPGVATGYVEREGYWTNSLHLPVIGSGDGGLFSTVDDIARLWTALFDGRIVSTDTAALMTSPHAAAPDHDARYGLGFWLHDTGPALRLEGYDCGVSFRSWHHPGTHATHTVIGNWSDAAWPVSRALRNQLGPHDGDTE